MPSRKDDPDARLTIGYSSYRLPRSGLVQLGFVTRSPTANVSPWRSAAAAVHAHEGLAAVLLGAVSSGTLSLA